MAKIKSSEGLRINATNNINSAYGGAIYYNTRTWSAYASGVNLFQIYQNGATSMKETVAISLKWIAFGYSTPELPMLNARARLSLNTNGQIAVDAWDWSDWSGNGILWPYVAMGGSSAFIGANNGMGYSVYGGVEITVSTLAWDKLVVVPYSN